MKPEADRLTAADKLFVRLSSETADRLSIGNEPASYIDKLVEAAATIPGITGALAAVCDGEGQTLRICSTQLHLRDDYYSPSKLKKLYTEARKKRPWSKIPHTYFKATGKTTIRARVIELGKRTSGIIFIGFPNDIEVEPLVEALEKFLPYFGPAILAETYLEKMRLYQEIRSLEMDQLGREGPPEPRSIAKRLKALYRADAVTIFFREQKELYPASATNSEATDELAGEQDATLIQYIFRLKQALRLRNIYDSTEVDIQTKGRCRPKTSARLDTEASQEEPTCFLGVPMVSDEQARGVIRIIRTGNSPFTEAEQETLQHFAHLLGLAMHSAWRLFLARNITGSDTEAICMTRNELEGDHKIPRVVYSDAGCRSLFNLTRDELDGFDARFLYAEDEYTRIRNLLRRVVRDGRSSDGPFRTMCRRFNSPGDEVRILDISYRLLTSPFAQPTTRYTIAVIRDVTKDQIKVNQHTRLINLLDKKGLAYFRADKDGKTAETSPTEMRLTGYNEHELAMASRKQLWAKPDGRQRLLEDIRRGGGELVNSMQLLKRKDGTTFMADAAVKLLANERGEEVGYEGLYEDVSERIRLQGFLDADTDRVLEEHELYVRLFRSQSLNLLFLTSLGHQLRSPLGALVEQLQNFKEGITDATRFSSRLEYAIGQARVSALFVANLTHMDMILRGEPFKYRPVNLAKLAIETKLDFIHLCRRRNLKFEVDDRSIDMYLTAWGHQNLIRQVFVNLVDNAIKYSFPGTEIVIRGHHDTKGRYLEISNQGLPVKGEDRKLIFNRGFRMGEAEALVPAGTGIGLWLVRKILTAHNAIIECDTCGQKGSRRTVFRIFFPPRSEVQRRRKDKK